MYFDPSSPGFFTKAWSEDQHPRDDHGRFSEVIQTSAADHAGVHDLIRQTMGDSVVPQLKTDLAHGGKSFVIRHEGKVIAHGMSKPSFAADDVHEVGWLATHPDFQGHGLASKMLSGLEDHARSTGANAMVLATATPEFYRKRGYRTIHGATGLMAKPLSAEKFEELGFLAKLWDETKHPRAPAGDAKGGEFVPEDNAPDVAEDAEHFAVPPNIGTEYSHESSVEALHLDRIAPKLLLGLGLTAAAGLGAYIAYQNIPAVAALANGIGEAIDLGAHGALQAVTHIPEYTMLNRIENITINAGEGATAGLLVPGAEILSVPLGAVMGAIKGSVDNVEQLFDPFRLLAYGIARESASRTIGRMSVNPSFIQDVPLGGTAGLFFPQ